MIINIPLYTGFILFNIFFSSFSKPQTGKDHSLKSKRNLPSNKHRAWFFGHFLRGNEFFQSLSGWVGGGIARHWPSEAPKLLAQYRPCLEEFGVKSMLCNKPKHWALSQIVACQQPRIEGDVCNLLWSKNTLCQLCPESSISQVLGVSWPPLKCPFASGAYPYLIIYLHNPSIWILS